jgi:MOSC domain-containing protein YiiM
MQLAVMQQDIADLIANGQPLTLFGDNLFLELDLSTGNLPIGSRLQAGRAILEVTYSCGLRVSEQRINRRRRESIGKPARRSGLGVGFGVVL